MLRTLTLLLGLAVLPSVPLAVAPAHAGDAVGEVPYAACVVNVRWDDTLNVRRGPGVRFAIRYAIPPSACGVRVNWNSCRGAWCRVTYRGRGGWAHTRYLG